MFVTTNKQLILCSKYPQNCYLGLIRYYTQLTQLFTQSQQKLGQEIKVGKSRGEISKN